jgi:hypothetical protein
MEIKPYYVTYTNSDLTEGRGYHIPIALCESESTAVRLGKGRYVQGGNCPVNEVNAVKIDGCGWYIPIDCVKIEKATEIDTQTDAKINAIKKAREVGLDETIIQALIK